MAEINNNRGEKRIDELEPMSVVTPDTMIPGSQGGEAKYLTGEQIADFARAEAEAFVARAEDAADQAEEAVSRLAGATANPPYIGRNGNWFVFDNTIRTFIDTGVPAYGSAPTISSADIEGGTEVTFTGSNSETIQIMDGESPSIAVTNVAGGHKVTIVDRDHPNGQMFTVLDGDGSGDMDAATYDPYGGARQVAFADEIPMISRPNILKNWYFVGGGSQAGGGKFPINSRGETAYAGYGYAIDCWKIDFDSGANAYTIELVSNGIKITNGGTQRLYFIQTLEAGTNDGKHTLSVYAEATSGNVIAQPHATGGNWLAGFHVTNGISNNIYDESLDRVLIQVDGGASAIIKAVKLELGDTQTLAHEENGVWVLNQIPDFNTEWFRVKGYIHTNRNLLHNWCFAGGGSQQGGGQFPINQRGDTSYSGTAGYCIDRWWRRNDGNHSVQVKLNSGGLEITADQPTSTWYHGICQPIECSKDLLGKTVTISALIKDYASSNPAYLGIYGSATGLAATKNYGQVLINGNGLFSKTIQMPTSFIDGNTYNKLNVNLPFSGNALSMTIVAVKLEIGDHQTLAHMDNAGNWVLNELPDFSEELLKCQRFLYVMDFHQLSAVALGYAYSAGIARFFIPFPVTMRDRPAFSYEGTFYIDGINNEVPRISRASYTTPHLAMLATTVVETAYTQYRPLLLVSENAGNKFIFSAEL